MWFSSWNTLVDLSVIAVCTYLGLMILIRLGGKRSISQMSMFDYVVTLALASILAKTILEDTIPLSDGLFSGGVLILLQYCVTWVSVRYKSVARFFEPQPTLVYYREHFMDEVMRQQRVTHREIYEAMRRHSFASLEQVQAVVLETNGSLSVIPNLNNDEQSVGSTCEGVEGWVKERQKMDDTAH